MNESNNQFEEEARRAREASRKMKRIVLIIAIASVVVLAVLYGVLLLLEQWNVRDSESGSGEKPPTVTYCTPDYNYNIMEDQDYLQLDRRIYYTTRTGERYPLNEENFVNQGPAVLVLKEMIEAIIAGDHEAYNELFSSNYFATEGNAPEEDFTMQRVYGIEFTWMAESSKTDEKTGKTYTQYEIVVEYKINKNDGTFRLDLGHDDSRKQYFVLSNHASDRVLIDQIIGYVYKN